MAVLEEDKPVILKLGSTANLKPALQAQPVGFAAATPR